MTDTRGEEPVRLDVALDLDWLRALATTEPLVPMRIPPDRLQRALDGAHDLFLRTDIGRALSCLFRPPDGAVREDGRPLTRVFHIDDVRPGCYMVVRDQVRFRPVDDSDPRLNGREYTVMVPAAVQHAEALPLDEIRRRGV